MGLFDWLSERRRNKENEREIQRLQARREAVIRSGAYSERDGLLVCPHCGYHLTREEIEAERERTKGLPADFNPRDFFQCPVCERALNY